MENEIEKKPVLSLAVSNRRSLLTLREEAAQKKAKQKRLLRESQQRTLRLWGHA